MTTYKSSGSAATNAVTKKALSNKFKFYELMHFLKDATDPVPNVIYYLKLAHKNYNN